MSDAPKSNSFWRRRVSRAWLVILAVALLLSAAAGALYLYYPAPADLLAEMWPLRTQVLAAVRSDSPESALASLEEWDRAAAQLPTALRLRGESAGGDVQARIDELRVSLAKLRLAIEETRKEEIAALAVECFEAHRLCAALFQVAPPASMLAAHDHGSHAHAGASHGGSAHAGHVHGRHDLGPDEPVPTIEISVAPDLKNKGWNLRTVTSDFRFAPEHASGEHVAGEGHGHLYVDGEKVTRLYSEWHFLGTLPPGSHTVRVTLNTNDHNDLVHNGEVIADEATLVVPGESDDELCRYPAPSGAGSKLPKEAILFSSGNHTIEAEKTTEKP